MKQIISGLLLLTSLVCLNAVHAQTADEIVSKYVDAIGGKDKIGQVKSIYMENNMAAMGNDNPNVINVLNGKGYKSETDFQGQKIIQCYTDKGAWQINPMAGSTSAEAMPADQYNANKELIDVGGNLYDYAAKGSKVELVGKDGGAFKIKLTTKENAEVNYWIDPATYYITKVVRKGSMMGQDVEITVKLSDYKKTDFGYVIPYSTEMDFGGQFQLTTTVKKVEINKTIDPAIFIAPK
jgi:outer membrane lipoprotein-sorting protein